jgi:hypothetical protein
MMTIFRSDLEQSDKVLTEFPKNHGAHRAASWRDRFTLTKLTDIVPDDDPL